MVNEKLFETVIEVWGFKLLDVVGGTVTIGSIIIGISVLLVGIFVSKIASRRISASMAQRFGLDKSVSYLFNTAIFYAFTVFSLLMALKLANIPLTIFTVLGGALAIGLGFGSQNLVNNFLSGIILMMERPVKVGDFIEVDSVFGEVEDIGIRSTSILTYGNKHIIVPNSSFLEKNVLNWTRQNKMVRIFIKVGVIYGSDTEKVRELLNQAVQAHSKVLKEKSIDVFFAEFADNSLNFQVDFWINLYELNDRRRVESDLRFEIDRLFREAKLTIAFPQRDVHLYSPEPISVKMAD